MNIFKFVTDTRKAFPSPLSGSNLSNMYRIFLCDILHVPFYILCPFSNLYNNCDTEVTQTVALQRKVGSCGLTYIPFKNVATVVGQLVLRGSFAFPDETIFIFLHLSFLHSN